MSKPPSLLSLCEANRWDEVRALETIPAKQLHKASPDEGLTPLHYQFRAQ